jgi:hypothetical protein
MMSLSVSALRTTPAHPPAGYRIVRSRPGKGRGSGDDVEEYRSQHLLEVLGQRFLAGEHLNPERIAARPVGNAPLAW